MAKRWCDVGNHEADLKGGKVCEKGHFLCYSHVHDQGILSIGARTTCPIDESKLR